MGSRQRKARPGARVRTAVRSRVNKEIDSMSPAELVNMLDFMRMHPGVFRQAKAAEGFQKMGHSVRSALQDIYSPTLFFKHLDSLHPDGEKLMTLTTRDDDGLTVFEAIQKEAATILAGVNRVDEILTSFSLTMSGVHDIKKVDGTEIHGKMREAFKYVRSGGAYQPMPLKLTEKLMAEPPAVTADSANFKEVCVCMIQNALDSMGNTGDRELTIESGVAKRSGQNFFELRIKDTGTGIKSGEKQKIMMPGYTTKGETGFGYGLPWSKELIEQMGGTLDIGNRRDGVTGAEVVIRLPLAQ